MDSVAERIMKHIETTLASITVGNGYQHTLHSVQRIQPEAQEPVHGNGVHIVDGDDVVEGVVLNGYDDLLSRRRHIDLVLVGTQDTAEDSRSASEFMNGLELDVRTALQADVSRGGLAVNTEETQANELDIQIGMPELRRVLGYDIRYRHRRNDPTIAG